MGFEPERIGVSLALEAHGLQLREAFDVGAVSREGLDASNEIDEWPGVCGALERPLARAEAQAGDLMRAAGDGEAQRRLVVDEDGFDVDAGERVAGEIVERLVIEHEGDHRGGAIAQGLDALAHGVQWEEVAQDDPEPFHAVNINRLWGR